MKKNKRSSYIVLLLLALFAVMILSTSIGPAAISPEKVVKVIVSRLSGQSHPYNIYETIVWQVRLPRTFIAAIVGMLLALAGVLLQGILRNPLADPYILGVSSGAGVGAAVAITLGLGATSFGVGSLPIYAFIGAIAAAWVVYRLAKTNGKATPETLILAGIAVGAFLSALLSLIVISGTKLRPIYFWLLGSLSEGSWEDVATMLPYLILGFIIAVFLAPRLNALLLGEESAHTLGVDVERTRTLAIFTATLVTAAAVSTCGIIGFVGLIIPHMVRFIWGPDHRTLVPLSALLGALVLLSADTVSRVLFAPTEIPIGIITAFIGVPFFIHLLRRKKKEL